MFLKGEGIPLCLDIKINSLLVDASPYKQSIFIKRPVLILRIYLRGREHLGGVYYIICSRQRDSGTFKILNGSIASWVCILAHSYDRLLSIAWRWPKAIDKSLGYKHSQWYLKVEVGRFHFWYLVCFGCQFFVRNHVQSSDVISSDKWQKSQYRFHTAIFCSLLLSHLVSALWSLCDNSYNGPRSRV